MTWPAVIGRTDTPPTSTVSGKDIHERMPAKRKMREDPTAIHRLQIRTTHTAHQSLILEAIKTRHATHHHSTQTKKTACPTIHPTLLLTHLIPVQPDTHHVQPSPSPSSNALIACCHKHNAANAAFKAASRMRKRWHVAKPTSTAALPAETLAHAPWHTCLAYHHAPTTATAAPNSNRRSPGSSKRTVSAAQNASRLVPSMQLSVALNTCIR